MSPSKRVVAPEKKARPQLLTCGCALFLSLVAVVMVVEALSRIADRVVAERANDPTYKPADAPRDVWEKLCSDTLVYGSPKRAVEQLHGARSRPHPYFGYALKPSWKTPAGTAQQASHNALGFRGRETTWEKPDGVYRICTTGGSSVYGQSESSDAAVWSQQLEDMLNAARPARRFEVVNLGVSGWTSYEMLANLSLRALDLSPDLVIVYEAINDMRAALWTPGGPVQRDNTHWRAPWPVDRPSRIEAQLERSHAYLVWRRYFTNYAQERVDLGFYAMVGFDKVLADRAFDPYQHYPGPVSDLGFESYRRNLVQMVAVCRARGARVAIATQALPRWHLDGFKSRNEQVDAFERILNVQREVAGEMQVPLCESARVVEAACEQEVREAIERAVAAEPGRPRAEIEAEWRRIQRRDLLFFSEVHPNDRGSALIARTIADWLLSGDLLPR